MAEHLTRQRRQPPEKDARLARRIQHRAHETDTSVVQRWMLTTHTQRPVQVQRQVAVPVLRAAELHREETTRVEGQREVLQRQVAELMPAAGSVAGALHRQAERNAPLIAPVRPSGPADWVTIMRLQAEAVEGRRLDSRQTSQFVALQRQVAGHLLQGYRADQSQERAQAYAGHLVALQRHPNCAPVARVMLGRLSSTERLGLQRAVDDKVQCETAQQARDDQALHVHQLQRQIAELEAEAAQPVLQRIQAKRGSGNPLPEAIQRHLEQGLNHDLSRVRIHDDAEADKLAKSVGAIAFATGTDIFFQSGRFNPNSRTGLELLAHEVTHTVQQAQGRVGPGIDPDAGLEAEARATGVKLATLAPRARRGPAPSAFARPVSTPHDSLILQRSYDAAAVNKAITLPPGQTPSRGWLANLGSAALKGVTDLPFYQAGMLAGVVEGFFRDLWENVKALGAVATQVYRLVQEVFTGQITGRIAELTAWAKGMSWNTMKEIAAGLGGQLKAEVLAHAQAWVQPDPFKRGQAQGKIVGMILAEVGIAYLTAGSVTAVKNSLVAGGKLAQVVGRIPGATRLIAQVQQKRAQFRVLAATTKTSVSGAAKRLIPEALQKKLGARGVAQAEGALQTADARAALKAGGQKAKELPLAVAQAVAIVTANDVLNTPVTAVLAQLTALKTRYSWIKKFTSTPAGAGKVDFRLIASTITIYKSYTPGTKGKWNKELNQALYEPNKRIDIGGYLYDTDSKGRVERVEGKLKLHTSDRNAYQQSKVGGLGERDAAGKKLDEGGHLIASIFNGAGERTNMVPMNANFNKGEWKKLENRWARELAAGKKVEVRIEMKYNTAGNDARPSDFVISYVIDGDATVVTLKNSPGGI